MMKSRFVITMCCLSMLVVGCASKPTSPGELMIQQGKGISSLGEQWNEGQKLVDEGRKMIEDGNDQVSEGRAKIEKGTQMMKESEKLFNQQGKRN